MLNNSAVRNRLIESEEHETPPNWSALEQVVEELLDLLGASHSPEQDETCDHLIHLEKFDWAKASQQGSSILRRR